MVVNVYNGFNLKNESFSFAHMICIFCSEKSALVTFKVYQTS
jgi:hypothetical protein